MSSIRSFTPRFLTAPEYVFALHEPSDQVAVLVRNRILQQTTQRILPAEIIASAPFQSWLNEQNLSGADIFIAMNPVREGSRNRRKEYIREIRHAYLDLDEQAGVYLQAIRTSGDVPPPNFVLDTSPGKHQVVWRVEGLDSTHAETLLRALASQYGGDPSATDISRLLRLPGFTNRKYNEAFVVRVHHETDALYHGQDFHVQEDSPESPRHLGDSQQSARKIPAGHRSQSEADWAYAKRALARGDHPEQIIQRIADFRADDKADPTYYARLTVIKAQLSSTSRESDAPARLVPGDSASQSTVEVAPLNRISTTRRQR
ncbi:MAG TPA: DNA-primase RepB domain-containing protein [Candidatus Dormibacteraeota bacterium]|nr:DNA-primase RepB domain-containing protein [Candidatus Dormibacteraeota bacterium]